MWDSMQMENYPNEVSVQEYMRLMKAFWDGRTDAKRVLSHARQPNR